MLEERCFEDSWSQSRAIAQNALSNPLPPNKGALHGSGQLGLVSGRRQWRSAMGEIVCSVCPPCGPTTSTMFSSAWQGGSARPGLQKQPTSAEVVTSCSTAGMTARKALPKLRVCMVTATSMVINAWHAAEQFWIFRTVSTHIRKSSSQSNIPNKRSIH